MSHQLSTLVWISSLTCFPGNNQCHDFSLMTTKLFWTSSLNCEASCQYPGYGVSNRGTPNCCGHCDCVFHDWDIVMCPNTGHFAASEEKLLLPRCDGLIRYVKIGNRNWSSAGVGLGQGGPNEMFKSGICLLEELLSGSAHTAAAARSGGQTWAGPCLGLLLTCCNMCW